MCLNRAHNQELVHIMYIFGSLNNRALSKHTLTAIVIQLSISPEPFKATQAIKWPLN